MENLLDSLDQYAKKHNVPIIDNPTKQYIETLLEETKPTYCMEIGSAIGYSTITIAHKIRTWGGKIISFECSYPSYMKALRNTKASGLLNIILYYGHFLKFSPSIFPNQIDFLFIDAEKASYLEYYLRCLPYLHKESTIVFDDVIKYEQKTSTLLSYLDTHGVEYTRLQLTDDDGIIVIDSNSSFRSG